MVGLAVEEQAKSAAAATVGKKDIQDNLKRQRGEIDRQMGLVDNLRATIAVARSRMDKALEQLHTMQGRADILGMLLDDLGGPDPEPRPERPGPAGPGAAPAAGPAAAPAATRPAAQATSPDPNQAPAPTPTPMKDTPSR